jgi:hypothetical protein
MTTFAPLALFVYRRLDHLRRTIDALRQNEEARSSALTVFSDGPRDAKASQDVAEVRDYLRGLGDGFASVRIVERPENLGLARSIIGGVTQLLEEGDAVIVIEDDLVTSPFFLRYMNDGLATYRDDERVISIHGYFYPVRRRLPETFFLRGADCWGWATWRRGWQLFNPDGAWLLNELKRRKLTRQFDFDGGYGYTSMLEDQIAGRNDSWAVRWYASAFLADKLTLYPGRSLVHNIGNDGSGVHSAATGAYDVELAEAPVRVGGIAVEESSDARRAFSEFGHAANPRPRRSLVAVAVAKRLLRWEK